MARSCGRCCQVTAIEQSRTETPETAEPLAGRLTAGTLSRRDNRCQRLERVSTLEPFVPWPTNLSFTVLMSDFACEHTRPLLSLSALSITIGSTTTTNSPPDLDRARHLDYDYSLDHDLDYARELARVSASDLALFRELDGARELALARARVLALGAELTYRDEVLTSLDRVLTDLDDALHDFTTADLRDVNPGSVK
jgi:hypothetical protein